MASKEFYSNDIEKLEIWMKGPRELKQYIARHRDHLKHCRWDDLRLMKLQDTCKKWYKRRKKPTHEEMNG